MKISRSRPNASAAVERPLGRSRRDLLPHRGLLAGDHDHARAAGQLLACLVRGHRDEQGVLPVQRRAPAPGDIAGHLHRPGRCGKRVQQGTDRGRLAGVPQAGEDRVGRALGGQLDRVEPAQLHAEAVLGYRVAAGCHPVQAGRQVRGDVADEDHGLAERARRRDQAPEPASAVGRGRVAGVGPGRAGQHGRGFDQHQVRADAFQHHVHVVRHQRVHGGVGGQGGTRFGGEHAGDDQPGRVQPDSRRAQARRGERGQEPFPAAGQVSQLSRRQRQGRRPRPGQAPAFPPQPDQVQRQLDAA